MEPLNITIADLSLDTVLGEDDRRGPITLADAIIESAVLRLTRDEEYRDIQGGLHKRVGQIRDEEIRTRVAAEVEAALTAPFRQTNTYGEAKGEPVTLRSLIVKSCEEFFTQDVSEYNKPRQTKAQRFVHAAVEDAVKKELAAAIVEEKAKVVAAVRAKAADLIAQAVKEGIGR